MKFICRGCGIHSNCNLEIRGVVPEHPHPDKMQCPFKRTREDRFDNFKEKDASFWVEEVETVAEIKMDRHTLNVVRAFAESEHAWKSTDTTDFGAGYSCAMAKVIRFIDTEIEHLEGRQ